MGTKVSYPVDVKEEAGRLRMTGVPVAVVMDRINDEMVLKQ